MKFQAGYNEAGFTLVESIVALLILAIGILSLYTMVTTTLKGNSAAQAMTVSSTVLADKLEELIYLSYDDSQLDTDAANNPHTITTGLPEGVISLSWTVTAWSSDGIDNDGDADVDEYDERGLKTINLSVIYNTIAGQKTHSIEFIKAEIFQ